MTTSYYFTTKNPFCHLHKKKFPVQNEQQKKRDTFATLSSTLQ